MTAKEFLVFRNEKPEVKKLTEEFNKLKISDRKVVLLTLSDEERDIFIETIRKQAVLDFWINEKELIKDGKCTRDWTLEQIERIMRISEATGIESINAYAPKDINGKAYEGHHMLNVATYPEYAGDWRNIQPLTYGEHYNNAHKDGTITDGYYNFEEKEFVFFEIDPDKNLFGKADDGTSLSDDYPPKIKCIFKSNQEIKAKYGITDDLKDGEMLALKITYRLDFIYFLYKTIPLVNFSNS